MQASCSPTGVGYAGVNETRDRGLRKPSAAPAVSRSPWREPRREFRCTSCDFTTAYKCSLMVHQRTHTGERPFQCRLCGKTFAHKCNLKSHLRVHTGEKPFRCPQCPQSFSQRSTLTAHLQTHAPQGAGPGSAWLAPAETMVVRLLGTEVRDGGPATRFGGGTNGRTPRGVRRYHCSFCNYSTIYKQTLQRHHRTHTGERPFECEYCLKTFAQKCNMKSHMRLHTGECPYKCQFCHASFRQRHLLTSHLQEEHAVRLAFKCGYCASAMGTQLAMKNCINDWNS
ncbi:unnamed protein product [Ixodes persulcatus]